MSTYLDVASLKAYLRIAQTDTLDDVLFAQIVDAVEAEQRARLRTETFEATSSFTVANDPAVSPQSVVATIVTRVDGPWTFTFGDGSPAEAKPLGVKTAKHTYTVAGNYLVIADATPYAWQLRTDVPVPDGSVSISDNAQLAIPSDVYQAALMRGARLYARRASPEGLVPFGDLGAARIPSFDRDIDALEAPWRTVVLA